MLKGLGDVGQIMKMQKEMKGMQKKLKKMVIQGVSPDGNVKATVNGEFKIISVDIDDKLLENSDKKQIEKQIVSAVNSAIDESKDFAAEQMSSITGGMDIPGLDKLMK